MYFFFKFNRFLTIFNHYSTTVIINKTKKYILLRKSVTEQLNFFHIKGNENIFLNNGKQLLKSIESL